MEETTETGSTWYESFLTGVGEFTSEALGIKAAGYLKGLQEDEGLRPTSNQQPAVVDANGQNLTSAAATESQIKTWIIYGGAALLILVIVARVLRG